MDMSILTIGDELLIGQVVNTNASWMAREFSRAGVRVREHLVTEDDIRAIHDALSRGLKRSDVVIVGGGLGPTDDDLTVQALAEYFKKPLRYDLEWHERIRKIFRDRGREAPENNRKQAMIPEGFERLDNEWGTAPGLWFEHEGKTIAVVPGVPYEMQGFMKKYILPRLASRTSHHKIYERTFMTTGIGESALAEKLGDIATLLSDTVRLAYLPSALGVRLRVNAFASSEETARSLAKPVEDRISQRLAQYVYGYDDEPFEDALGRLLKEKKRTLATAESCTGGLVGHRITNTSGSSAYYRGGFVAYDNSVKIEQLGIDAKIIEAVGAVSEEVARAMAEKAREILKADIGIGITGIAGPTGGTTEKPVGLVWIAIAHKNGIEAHRFLFERDRARNKERAAQAALNLIRLHLLDAS